MRNVKVYGLCSSADGEIRYVGQTVRDVRRRKYEHVWEAKNRRNKQRIGMWIRSVLRKGEKVVLFVIEENCIFNQTEKRWIAFYKRNFANLVNCTEGGEGTLGWCGNKGNKRPDLSERNRANAGKQGRPMTEENRLKLSMANKGKKKPWLSERNKLRKGMKGKPHTEEAKLKISNALKGRVITWGDKISEAKRNNINEQACA